MVVDFHNHLIPGVDDGAQTEAESIDALRSFARAGVSVVVTTPHIDASLTLNAAALADRLSEIDDGWEKLEACGGSVPRLQIYRGAELALTVPEPDLSDRRLRLGGTHYFLVEFPSMTVVPNSGPVLKRIAESGFTPIIAHPERYYGVDDCIALAQTWKESGALLQINGGSILGLYGQRAKREALRLLERGLSDYLCSDYHARGSSLVGQYRALLEGAGANEQAQTLMETNPARMLEGLPPLPVAPLHMKEPVWDRLSAMFRGS